MYAIAQVMEHYSATYGTNLGVSHRNGTADERALLDVLPNFFRGLLSQQGRDQDFKVEGSFGNGNMPKVPWVGIFNNLVTTSAQEGYYIVLLFSEDMQSCFLSLNQGVTELKTQYGQSLARTKMINAANQALHFFHRRPDALTGQIDLKASSHLGRGYEAGAIESHRYTRDDLPEDFYFARDFFSLLDHYDQLVSLAGPSLQFLAPITEDEFHQAAMRKAVTVDVDNEAILGPLPIPAISNTKSQRFSRNVRYAAFALKRAHFLCEIDNEHPTFLTRTGKRKYVEAHHLVPMSQQNIFQNSLDHPSNIVALCTHCHKLLHHGRAIDKRAYLSRLLGNRKLLLTSAGICPSETALLSFYNKILLEQE